MPEDPAPSQYIHGTTAEEQSRLSLMNDLLNRAALREMGLSGGEKILDVGSGLGQLARAMARAAGRVVGVERSPEQIAEARRQALAAGEEGRVEFRAGDAPNLPLRDDEWGTFDVAHTRFLLEHVRDPAAVVRAMVRTVRPGGRVVLQDDSHDVLRVTPEPAGFGPLWTAYIRTYDRLGNDPYVGHRLVSLLAAAGAAPVHNTWLFFGGCRGAAHFDLVAENLIRILEIAGERILHEGLLEKDTLSASLEALRAWRRLPDAALWYAVSWAEGRRAG